MADTVIATANREEQWDNDAFLEYVRENEMAPYMGTDENAAIQLDENLTKKPGDGITFSLIGKFKNANIGTGILEGNEEAVDNTGHKVEIEVVRNAFTITNFEDQVTGIDIRNKGKTQMKNWAMDLLRNKILDAFHSINGTVYGTATNAAQDAWAADNNDRVVYVGYATAPADHSAGLVQLTGGTDTLSATVVSLARRKARTGNPAIKPIRVNGSEEWYVMFCDTYAFRDLKADTAIQAAQRDALARGQGNPLFRAGDIIWDGVICREVPEISNLIDDTGGAWGTGATANGLATAGASSARVGVSFLSGAQSVGLAWGKRLTTTTDTREYGFVRGFGVEEFRGVEKFLFQTPDGNTNPVDHGMVTVYTASALD